MNTVTFPLVRASDLQSRSSQFMHAVATIWICFLFLKSSTNPGWSRMSQKSIILLTLLLLAVVVVFCLPSTLPPFWMLFLVSICTFSTEVFSVMVRGGCRSQGCHGYLLGSLAAPFCFSRHLPHTHLLLMGLILFCPVEV